MLLQPWFTSEKPQPGLGAEEGGTQAAGGDRPGPTGVSCRGGKGGTPAQGPFRVSTSTGIHWISSRRSSLMLLVLRPFPAFPWTCLPLTGSLVL